jgi:FlgD Ig-like domain
MKTQFYGILLMALVATGAGFAQTRTPWEMNLGEGIVAFGFTAPRHGDSTEYQFATIPTPNDPNWGPAPDPNIINFSLPISTLCGMVNCLEGGDFTYFRTFVDIPANVVVTQFTISTSGVDDGTRVTIFNSKFPNGKVVPGSYVYLGGSGTTNLKDLVMSGEINTVIMTHIDDCCSQSFLNRAQVVLNGEIVEPVELLVKVDILSPTNNAIICDDSVKVIGETTIMGGTKPFNVSCEVNGVPASISGNQFMAKLARNIGTNIIIATCTVVDSTGQQAVGRDTIQVTGTAPPVCTVDITAPQESITVCDKSIKVTGVTAITGGVPPLTVTCEVNGVAASISGNTLTATVPLSPGWNDIIAACTVTDSCGKKTVCRDTTRVFSIKDDTPPTCVFNFGYKSITGTLFDHESGIAKIVPTFLFNSTIKIDPFQPGAKQVNFRLDAIDFDSYIGFDIEITDLCGNSHICDPVLFQLSADESRQYGIYFRSVDRYLTLTNHGLTKIRVDLNGKPFSLFANPNLAGQERNSYRLPLQGAATIDLQAYLREGENHIHFEIEGPTGAGADMLLIDEAHAIDYALEIEPLPTEFQLAQNYPNPFNPTTTIHFSIPARQVDGTQVQLRVYNALGEVIRTLVDEKMFPGQYTAVWDGRNTRGEQVSSGIYIYQLITSEFKQTRRMTVLR